MCGRRLTLMIGPQQDESQSIGLAAAAGPRWGTIAG
jgi:hypothetical protein